MAKTASQIVDRALVLIDEIPTTFATAASTETSIRDLALSILPEVCRDLVKELPWELKMYLAEDADYEEDELLIGEDQSSYTKKKLVFRLPDDFWELVSFKLLAWSKEVTEYIFINDPGYQVQHNPFTRAGKRNPVVAVDTANLGQGRRIECFSIGEGDSAIVETFLYVSFDNVPDDVGTTWPDELFDEITKALATELNIIKSRMEEAVIRGEGTINAIEQHE